MRRAGWHVCGTNGWGLALNNTEPAPPLRALLARRTLLLAPLAAAATPARAEWLRDGIVLYAEPALLPVLDALDGAYRRTRPGAPVIFTAPPGQLLGLLAHDTQADILIVQRQYMETAQVASLVKAPIPGIWRNRLVVVGPRGVPDRPFSAAALAQALAGGILAVPDASDASAIDGPALLQRLDLPAGIRVQGTAGTRDALDMVHLGTAALAICHETERLADPGLSRAMALPDSAYPPITYQAALTTRAWSRYQDALLAYITGPGAPIARAAGLAYPA
jgi:hypothetical protein